MKGQRVVAVCALIPHSLGGHCRAGRSHRHFSLFPTQTRAAFRRGKSSRHLSPRWSGRKKQWRFCCVLFWVYLGFRVYCEVEHNDGDPVGCPGERVLSSQIKSGSGCVNHEPCEKTRSRTSINGSRSRPSGSLVSARERGVWKEEGR